MVAGVIFGAAFLGQVIDQVMDRDGPEVARQLTRAVTDLFD